MHLRKAGSWDSVLKLRYDTRPASGPIFPVYPYILSLPYQISRKTLNKIDIIIYQ